MIKVAPRNSYTTGYLGLINCTDEQYFADPGINNSGLTTIKNKSPYHFHMLKRYDNKTTPALRIGSLVHALVLESPPLDDFPVFDGASFKSKAGAEFLEANKNSVLKSELEKAQKIVKYASEQNDLISNLQEKAQHKEVSVFVDRMGFRAKAKADAIYHSEKGGIIWDVKTTEDLFDFVWSCRKYGYHMQRAWYMELFQLQMKRKMEYRLLVIEKKYPYSVVEYNFSDRVNAAGRRAMEEAFASYTHCEMSGVWIKPDTNITLDWRP